MDKPYCFSHPSLVVKNASQEEEGKVGVMWLDGWPGLQLPYFPNGKYADIYDPSGKKILTIDLSSEAACNENGICDRPMEDQINCGSDCSALKNSAALMDTNPKGEKANPPRNTGLGRFGVYIFVALVSVSLFVLGLWVWRKVKGNNVV